MRRSIGWMLAWYWGIAVVVPLLRGAELGPQFREHALTALAAGLLLLPLALRR